MFKHPSRQAFVLAALFFVNAFAAQAAPVTVNPGAWEGIWRIGGVTGLERGEQTVELAEGNYSIAVGASAAYAFTVDAAGNVTSAKPASIVGGPGNITFNTVTVRVEPGDFDNQTLGQPTPLWGINRGVRDLSGPQDVQLVPDGRYGIIVGSVGGFTIYVDPAGNVTVENPVSATASGNVVTFNTVDIFVDPGQFLNQPLVSPAGSTRWGIGRVVREVTEPGIVKLVPGTRYFSIVGTYGGFIFHVDATGDVSLDNPQQGVGGSGSLTFNTVDIALDPGTFLDQPDGGATAFWGVSRILGNALQAPATARVVPHTRVGVIVGTFGTFFISADESGAVTVENGISAQTSGGNLVFETESIVVDPGAYTGAWGVSRAADGQQGAQVVQLVPGVRYRLTGAGEFEFFTVNSPCAVEPSAITLGGFDFDLGCGLLDGDADGVPDTSDNCPAVPNADQLDLDADGTGDACDPDRDGDGVEDAFDNCADFSNPDQADLDGDGIGDACDDDADGDSVVDAEDNCPLIANPDQGDNDADGAGDACDLDDDNDTVQDAADNCPLVFNADQADFDGNGVGDACDADVDGDSVLNADDDCAETPGNEPVTANGCSGAQFVVLRCPEDTFVNHGRYVSCVARTANDLRDIGLIDEKRRAVLVREAAKK